jgi:hypothetical protein
MTVKEGNFEIVEKILKNCKYHVYDFDNVIYIFFYTLLRRDKLRCIGLFVEIIWIL